MIYVNIDILAGRHRMTQATATARPITSVADIAVGRDDIVMAITIREETARESQDAIIGTRMMESKKCEKSSQCRLYRQYLQHRHQAEPDAFRSIRRAKRITWSMRMDKLLVSCLPLRNLIFTAIHIVPRRKRRSANAFEHKVVLDYHDGSNNPPVEKPSLMI